MSALPANIELLVATMDLKLVQLIRGAMRAADVAAGRHNCDGIAHRNLDPSPRLRPHTRIEPRQVIHPTPRFEPRPVIHSRQPREIPAPLLLPATPEQPRINASPLPPPWKVLPWQIPPQPLIQVKVVRRRPDIVRKGSLVDVLV